MDEPMGKPYEPYENQCLKQIAGKVFRSTSERETVKQLIRDGKVAAAKIFILSGVDDSYRSSSITLSEAAEFYNRIEMPFARFILFPQKHLKVSQ